MKALVRWSTALGLLGSVVAGSMLTLTTRAIALTEEQVVEQLRPVPVFAITDAEGSPLVAAPAGEDTGEPVAGVFISQEDAQAFLNNLREANPELAQDVQVVPVSLAEVYELALATRDDANRINFTFVPEEEQVATAVSLLQAVDQTVTEFEGVPLFMARAAGEDGGYLTVRRGQEQIIPVFFNQEELEQVLARLGQQQPDLAAEMTIQVINLENFIETLRASDDPGLTQIELVPPRESIDYIRSLNQQDEAAPESQP